MADLRIKLRNAQRQPLQDLVDIVVTDQVTRQVAATKRAVDAKKTIRVTGLQDGRAYLLQVFPLQHRAVGRFLRLPHSGSAEPAEFFCPVHPSRVIRVVFPEYAGLAAPLRRVLELGGVEEPKDVAGQALYEKLRSAPEPLACAGTLNVFSKSSNTALLDGSTVWDHVQSVYRLRGDRVFAHVSVGLRDLVKSAVSQGVFRSVDGALHKADEGFEMVDSYKTTGPLDRHGNLQITFFARTAGPIAFKADIDVDNSSGLEHVFDVLGHFLTGGDTHPYDIHQILTFHQQLVVAYELVLPT
jgi:hypothetical protein